MMELCFQDGIVTMFSTHFPRSPTVLSFFFWLVIQPSKIISKQTEYHYYIIMEFFPISLCRRWFSGCWSFTKQLSGCCHWSSHRHLLVWLVASISQKNKGQLGWFKNLNPEKNMKHDLNKHIVEMVKHSSLRFLHPAACQKRKVCAHWGLAVGELD